MNNINDLLVLFRNKKIKNISEDDFLKKTNEMYDKHKKIYPTLKDIFNDFPLSLILDKILDEILIDNEKINTFSFNNKKRCCLAPYSTINFDTMGIMRVCCYNNQFVMGRYPEKTIIDAWNNDNRKLFIKNLTNLDFSMGCNLCRNQIIENNIENSLFSDFDEYENEILEDYPIIFNFDFGTICNYECIMCGGKWSSSIRKNREKLPPIISPYDDNFVNQLEQFIPHLKVCNFLGGEPFLNSIYYKILDLISHKNPNIRVNITTNGSIFNSRIKTYFEKISNLNIIVSLDSLDEKTYQKIRKNGNFNLVMDNIEQFKKYRVLKGITFCPMIQNVHELPDIILFCIKNNIDLGINDVNSHLGGKIKGIHEGETENTLAWVGSNDTMQKINIKNDELIPEVALKTLNKKELENIIKTLIMFPIIKHIDFKINQHCVLYKKYKSFINKLIYIHSQK